MAANDGLGLGDALANALFYSSNGDDGPHAGRVLARHGRANRASGVAACYPGVSSLRSSTPG